MRWKKGISPVMATVLLVAITLILAVIIFLWARSFVVDSAEKEGRDIKLSCEEVSFRAESFLSEGNLSIENTGRVPLYGAEVRKKKILGEIKKVGTFQSQNLKAGETDEISLGDLEDLKEGDTLIVVPILLGVTDNSKKAYVCDEKDGVEITVKA